MFLIYHRPIRCARSKTLRTSSPASRTLCHPTLLPHRTLHRSQYVTKNHAYKNRSTYRQGSSTSAGLLPGRHLPGHGVRNVFLPLPNHDNGAHKATVLERNANSTPPYTDTAPARSPWTQRPKQLQKAAFQIALQVILSTNPPPSEIKACRRSSS